MARSWRTPAVLLLAAAALQGACADFSAAAADALIRHASTAALAAASSTGAAAATHGSERAAVVRVVQAKLRGLRLQEAAPTKDGGDDDPMATCISALPCYTQMMAVATAIASNFTAMNITDATKCPMSAATINACYGVRPIWLLVRRCGLRPLRP
jgi:hypothetical protein